MGSFYGAFIELVNIAPTVPPPLYLVLGLLSKSTKELLRLPLTTTRVERQSQFMRDFGQGGSRQIFPPQLIYIQSLKQRTQRNWLQCISPVRIMLLLEIRQLCLPADFNLGNGPSSKAAGLFSNLSGHFNWLPVLWHLELHRYIVRSSLRKWAV